MATGALTTGCKRNFQAKEAGGGSEFRLVGNAKRSHMQWDIGGGGAGKLNSGATDQEKVAEMRTSYVDCRVLC